MKVVCDESVLKMFLMKLLIDEIGVDFDETGFFDESGFDEHVFYPQN